MKVRRQRLAEEDDVWFEYRSVQGLRTLRTMWNSLLEDLLLDLVALDTVRTVLARGRRERSVTLDETLDGTEMFERVDILRVVAKQLVASFQLSDEVVSERRLVLARPDLFGETKERTRIVGKIVDVEHRLWIRQFGKFFA